MLYTEEESTYEIVEKIGELINVEIEEGDISISHRLRGCIHDTGSSFNPE